MSKKKAKRPRGRPKKLIKNGTPAEVSQVIKARAVAAKLIENPALSASDAIRAVGLSEYAATHPSLITKSAPFIDLLNEYLPDGDLLETHKGLLKAASIDHMVFTDGARNENEAAQYIADQAAKGNIVTREDILTDDDIRAMLKEKNCDVRRISRTQNSRHVYFWSPDSRARKDALDMAYKLRGSYAADKAAVAFSLAQLAKMRLEQDSAPRISAPRDTPMIAAVDEE